MAQYKVRVDTGPAREPLKDNPFAVLGGSGAREGPCCEPMGEVPPAASVKRVFTVGRTRKGGYGLALEKRPNGKQVTVLRNVQGDAEALLSMLKKRCGAGGAVRGEQIELQGDHRAAVEAFLLDLKAG